MGTKLGVVQVQKCCGFTERVRILRTVLCLFIIFSMNVNGEGLQ
jgi:hypothetical protein